MKLNEINFNSSSPFELLILILLIILGFLFIIPPSSLFILGSPQNPDMGSTGNPVLGSSGFHEEPSTGFLKVPSCWVPREEPRSGFRAEPSCWVPREETIDSENKLENQRAESRDARDRESSLIMQQSDKTRVRLGLMLHILKAREDNDLAKATQLTQVLREVIANQNQNQ
ncbi:hypothetical protein SLEP1_g44265 [Rubroshorea leprosula]|uniref:Uncharacterized protein n=1 Tax=Rubroshorea leprosula TaxID=152421 RepID=A0AAV5LGR6_9ROSI|nr:hypothetical protein SLEP1_g44265 [Rubroshorea leprosula]